MNSIKYRVFKRWREIDDMPESKDFMFYETSNGSIIGLSYPDMIALFRDNSKRGVIVKNAILTCGIDNALSCGRKEGQINI